ncbi:hypothetical protein GBA65_05045 [Rubrobacter marinus]|uniref:Uncharacterized protein n=1 Tax=Rubrobacter marinus TaxID=2653852 RepID=A0A6G8PTZ6_9ACTN|nr:hypothetical protein [Rubrobacter marinus]QIN77988.1 hypothetical protein GBA65_05045 [Rubrobacter marinus]
MDRKRVARVISAATRLPLIAVPLFLLVGVAVDGVAGILWGALCILLTSGLSLLYLLYLIRSGRVADPGRIEQGERTGPLRVVAGLHAGAWVLVALLDGPAELRAVLLSYALATAAFALLTPFSKISLHAAGVAGAGVCLAWIFGPWGAVAFLVLPAVAWARLTLARHTPLELLLGTLVGGGLTTLAFFVTVS